MDKNRVGGARGRNVGVAPTTLIPPPPPLLMRIACLAVMRRTSLMALPTVARHRALMQNPATRNRTRDHLIAAAIYSQMLYQLSYSRLATVCAISGLGEVRLYSSTYVRTRVRLSSMECMQCTSSQACRQICRREMPILQSTLAKSIAETRLKM